MEKRKYVSTRKIKITPMGSEEDRKYIFDILREQKDASRNFANILVTEYHIAKESIRDIRETQFERSDRTKRTLEYENKQLRKDKAELEKLKGSLSKEDYKFKKESIEDLLKHNTDEIKTAKEHNSTSYKEAEAIFIKELQMRMGTILSNEDLRISVPTSISGILQKICLARVPRIQSNVASAVAQKVMKAYSNDLVEVLQGKRSLRTYKQYPIEFPAKTFYKSKCFAINVDDDKEYVFKWMGKNGIHKWNLTPSFKLIFKKDVSSKTIVDRVISGEYRALASSFTYDKKKKAWFLNLTFEGTIADKNLDKNTVVGVDLGIAIPAVCALNKGYAREYIGSGKEITKFRFQMQKRRETLYRTTKDARKDKGLKRKLKAINTLSDYESRWVKDKNNLFSRKVVDFATKNNAGRINLEFLEGFSDEHKSNMVLGRWTYYQLGMMIKQKAEKEGIEVQYIDPYHTSQTCSVCGNYEKGQRKTQAEFVCGNPDCKSNTQKKEDGKTGFKMNADWNAAVNIAKSTAYVKSISECEYTKLKRAKIA